MYTNLCFTKKHVSEHIYKRVHVNYFCIQINMKYYVDMHLRYSHTIIPRLLVRFRVDKRGCLSFFVNNMDIGQNY